MLKLKRFLFKLKREGVFGFCLFSLTTRKSVNFVKIKGAGKWLIKLNLLKKKLKKIEDRLGKLKKNKAESALDKNIQVATVSLLKNVIEDLRQQQQKLTK